MHCRHWQTKREEKTAKELGGKISQSLICFQLRKLAVIAMVTQFSEGCLPRYNNIIFSVYQCAQVHTVLTVWYLEMGTSLVKRINSAININTDEKMRRR